MDYETLSAEVLAASDRLVGADAGAIADEVLRLTELAEQIPDEFDRFRGKARAAKLPTLISGPPIGTSPEYERATQLVGKAMSATGTSAERIAIADQAATEIAALAAAAPDSESGTILRMNSAIARLIEKLRADS
ncbi:hypothetical protein HPO96_33430 [Kribbella sandramycini]|uniref:Uncharacterized protein n=1 Tax=Kribbella sandramycini TaxID=60450 RepID=A0A7Y4L6F0_9ACTN|nr:hypothetical protein [Kribbella sandramycini]MBB6566163.1 hypothetical protein [Kribbella sandramycini]NOL45163.1 hypothetical protein [Kribbella sandramycini]